MPPLTPISRSFVALGADTRSVWTAPAVAFLAALLMTVGCAKKPEAVVVVPPPLVVPAVPPRLVGPVQVEEEAPPPVEEAPERPAPRTAPRTPRVTRGATDPAPSKPADATAPGGSASSEAPKPDGETPPASAEQPSPLLRTLETADDREATRRVKEIIGRAESNLSRVNYKGLSTAAKAQHDTATRLIAQAEDALKVRSFTFARFLADKAEVLSGSLVNR